MHSCVRTVYVHSASFNAGQHRSRTCVNALRAVSRARHERHVCLITGAGMGKWVEINDGGMVGERPETGGQWEGNRFTCTSRNTYLLPVGIEQTTAVCAHGVKFKLARRVGDRHRDGLAVGGKQPCTTSFVSTRSITLCFDVYFCTRYTVPGSSYHMAGSGPSEFTGGIS